jgi:hypothetical protein
MKGQRITSVVGVAAAAALIVTVPDLLVTSDGMKAVPPIKLGAPDARDRERGVDRSSRPIHATPATARRRRASRDRGRLQGNRRRRAAYEGAWEAPPAGRAPQAEEPSDDSPPAPPQYAPASDDSPSGDDSPSPGAPPRSDDTPAIAPQGDDEPAGIPAPADDGESNDGGDVGTPEVDE